MNKRKFEKSQMKAELIKLFGTWWDGGVRDGSPYVGEKTFELMADACLAVLFAVDDIQDFLHDEGLLK